MRTLKLAEQLIEFLPVVLGGGEFAMLTRLDVLGRWVVSWAQKSLLSIQSYLIKVLELVTAILAIPGLGVPLHWLASPWGGLGLLRWTSGLAVLFVLGHDAQGLLSLALGSTRWRLIVVIESGSDVIHIR